MIFHFILVPGYGSSPLGPPARLGHLVIFSPFSLPLRSMVDRPPVVDDDVQSLAIVLRRLWTLCEALYVAAAFFNAIVFATYISPFYFPVDVETLNCACITFGVATTFGILSRYFAPDKWLVKERILQALADSAQQSMEHVDEPISPTKSSRS
ncbi:hypothetical protein EW146_g4623 [Bondarzewia mesenterica]|uniref:Uncharacterized protein n=1 Tax=Bondarzewia mesenterica TaxID=1095465 RepID=A0A4S4LU44_9AGAM|nr:hypothetical protein EW146_g4623 [Bondarzewia mesenterica]